MNQILQGTNTYSLY